MHELLATGVNYCGGFEGNEAKLFINGRHRLYEINGGETDSVKKIGLRDSVTGFMNA